MSHADVVFGFGIGCALTAAGFFALGHVLELRRIRARAQADAYRAAVHEHIFGLTATAREERLN